MPAAAIRSRSWWRVSGPSCASARAMSLTARSAAAGETPSWGQSPRVAGRLGGRGERVQPRVVDAANEVQRAAVEPRDDERALLAEGAIEIRGGAARAARPHRQPRAAAVLGLHRQQPLRHARGVRRALSGEQLGSEALSDHRPPASIATLRAPAAAAAAARPRTSARRRRCGAPVKENPASAWLPPMGSIAI
jgi:hypothetical protein